MAEPSRFFSETSMVITWCLRAVSELRTWVSASLRGRTSGRTASAKWARTPASRVSVLASVPVALAKSLTWRVDHHHRQRRSGQGGHQGQFQAARSLQQHQGRLQVHYLGDQSLNSGLVVGQGSSLPRGPDSNVHLRL